VQSQEFGIEQGSEMEAAPTINKKRKRKKKDMQMVQCGHCGRMGHLRPTSFDCLKNPKNMLLVQAENAKQAREKGTSSRPCVTLSCLCTHFAVLSTVLSTYNGIRLMNSDHEAENDEDSDDPDDTL
jgi:hypothetical protein